MLKFQIDKKTGLYYLRRATTTNRRAKQDRRLYKQRWNDKNRIRLYARKKELRLISLGKQGDGKPVLGPVIRMLNI